VKTDLQISVPKGCYGRIAPRSGLALNFFIDIGAGVIDADFRGNVAVLIFNFGDNAFHIQRGDRIAQLICEKIESPEIVEVFDLDCSQRGDKGFGSSGVSN
jgi:dUTP pyrophosphatase